MRHKIIDLKKYIYIHMYKFFQVNFLDYLFAKAIHTQVTDKLESRFLNCKKYSSSLVRSLHGGQITKQQRKILGTDRAWVAERKRDKEGGRKRDFPWLENCKFPREGYLFLRSGASKANGNATFETTFQTNFPNFFPRRDVERRGTQLPLPLSLLI